MDSVTALIILGRVSYAARPILLNLSVVYGPITATMTAICAFISRAFITGGDLFISIWGIGGIYVVEMLIIFYLKARNIEFTRKYFALLTVISNMIAGMTIFVGAGGEWTEVFYPVLTFVTTYPLATILAYRIMEFMESSSRLLEELSIRDEEINKANTELKGLIE